MNAPQVANIGVHPFPTGRFESGLVFANSDATCNVVRLVGNPVMSGLTTIATLSIPTAQSCMLVIAAFEYSPVLGGRDISPTSAFGNANAGTAVPLPSVAKLTELMFSAAGVPQAEFAATRLFQYPGKLPLAASSSSCAIGPTVLEPLTVKTLGVTKAPGQARAACVTAIAVEPAINDSKSIETTIFIFLFNLVFLLSQFSV